MKSIAIIMASLIMLSCATSNTLPPITKIKPSVSEEGTLADEKLISDTTSALVDRLGIQPNTEILKFVIQKPVGKTGARAWREVWIVRIESGPRQFIITFREDGLNAAHFEIQEM